LPLNKLQLDKVRKIVRAGKRGLWADGGGLWLQITRSGSASWIFRYQGSSTSAKGHTRRRYMGLGPLHTVTLAAAREAARKAREARYAGADPIGTVGKRTVRESTFALCMAACLKDREAGKHATAGWQPSLTRYAIPVLGTMPVAAITIDDVLRVLKPIWTTKTETANKLRRYIEAVLDHATHVAHLRSGQNPASWELLEHVLKSPKKVAPAKAHPSMDPVELPEFMRELAGINSIRARALEFLILTVSRTGDVVGAPGKPPMRWADVDLDRAVWTIPKDKMDNVDFQVPLSEAAVVLLRALPRKDERVFVIAKDAMWELFKSMRPDLSVHGFRSTFSGWAANRYLGGIDDKKAIIEVVLKHRVHQNETEKAYSRHVRYSEERARVMELWGQFACGKEEAKVVHLRA
jgi:integrase